MIVGPSNSRQLEAMQAVRRNTTVTKDGELHFTDLPVSKGERIEVIILVSSEYEAGPIEILKEEAIGMWADRKDISDSAVYARQLREKAQHRV